MDAVINKIIDFSTVDGPGLRTSIFVQKCNIHCLYCHNPETQNLCTNCAICVSSCQNHALYVESSKVKYNEALCINCDTCIKVCPHNASPKVKVLSANDVYNHVKKNIPFIRGITVSGGECMMYPNFLVELFKLAKQDNLTCLLDSNGTVLFENYKELVDLTDGVMLDVKSWDNDVFYKLTGHSNENVIKNLIYLAEIKKIEELRIVCLDGYVDAKDVILGIKETITDYYQTIPLKLIKFRKFGVKGILKDYQSPSDESLEQLKEYAISKGFKNVFIR